MESSPQEASSVSRADVVAAVIDLHEERDEMRRLLGHVAEGHSLTNRLGEAIVIVPAHVMERIRRALGRGG